MKTISLQEFKPTLFFLLKFVGLYLAGNIFYGIYVTGFKPGPDPITKTLTRQSSAVLNFFGQHTSTIDQQKKATTLLLDEERTVLAVYEGCNGLNTIIIFLSFLLAFGPYKKTLLWFIPSGILIIHFANLGRIVLLFFTALYRPEYMYYVHKYFFTAILYMVIFALWWWWVSKYSIRRA